MNELESMYQLRNDLAAGLKMVERIITKMEISVKQPDTFLAEMNSTNDYEPQAEYHNENNLEMVEAPPSIPDLEGIEPLSESTAKEEPQPSNLKNKEVLIEKFGLEEILDSNGEKFIKLCKWVILSGASAEKVNEFLFGKGLAITSDQEEHLEQLRKIRRSMLAKDMDLQTAKSQYGIETFERVALETLAKENGLK
jgi:hypothetical protein